MGAKKLTLVFQNRVLWDIKDKYYDSGEISPEKCKVMMLPKVFLLDECVSNLKCIICNHYLSVPPVCMYSNDPICGRCVTQKEQKHRAYFYEDLARFMFFPCMYDIYGCNMQLAWGKVSDHEDNCIYRRIVCPATFCDDKIGTEEIINHFKIKHQQLILKKNEDYVPPVDVASTGYIWVNKLYERKDHSFLVQTQHNCSDFFIRISTITGCLATQFNVKMTLDNKDQIPRLLNNLKTVAYNTRNPCFSSSEKIDITAISGVPGTKIKYWFNFEEDVKYPVQHGNNGKMLSELECPICTHYMKPPIYMCMLGHSLCAVCKTKLPRCPSCSSEINDARCYALERIVQYISYPCKFNDQGCEFMGRVDDVAHHEIICPKQFQRKLDCFVKHVTGCTWSGDYASMYRHLISFHDEYCYILGYSVSVKTTDVTFGFLEYDNNIFELYVDWSKDKKNGMYISVALIKCKENVGKYLFYLDFKNEKTFFSVSEICHKIPVSNVNQKCANGIDIPLRLLNRSIKENKITFLLNIANIVK